MPSSVRRAAAEALGSHPSAAALAPPPPGSVLLLALPQGLAPSVLQLIAPNRLPSSTAMCTGTRVPTREMARSDLIVIWGGNPVATQVNVMAHVYAARAVLPSMVAMGDGYLLQTASAAGLLTQMD